MFYYRDTNVTMLYTRGTMMDTLIHRRVAMRRLACDERKARP
jgi:hypothetical protein